ncbi:MAG: hypothetical protein Q8P51_17570 [Ignavibacteria bacterium]|nr:hypothetical protein [Ignavibacteria bacterium]
MFKARGHLLVRMLLVCTLIVFFPPHSYGQDIQKGGHVLETVQWKKLDFRDVHKDSLSVPESTSKELKLIVGTGATLEGGDGWRIKHSLGIGCEKQLLFGLSVIGFLDYARFDYHALQTLHPPYRTGPSHALSIATVLKAQIPWHVSPFIQVGLGISYVSGGTLYYHDQYRYPPTPETDYVGGGRSGLTYLVNFMLGVEIYPFKNLALFLEGGLNGNWRRDLYPANSLGRVGIEVVI